MLIEVVATYRLADDSPDRGYVLFRPVVTRSDATPQKHIITQSPVKAVLDAFGSIHLMLTDSWDIGWMAGNGGQPVPYLIEEHLSGGKRCYTTLLKGPVFDLGDAIPPDDNGYYVVADNEVTVAAAEPARWEIWADSSVVEPVIP